MAAMSETGGDFDSGQNHTVPDEPQKKLFTGPMFGGDRVLWIILAILAIVSLLVVYSSTASMAYRKVGGDTSHYLMNQLKYILLGFLVIWFVHRVNYQVYARFARLAFLISIGFMILTFFVGLSLNDASRWLRIPFIGLTFQPSDFLKVTLVMVLAQQLAQRQKNINRIPILPKLSVWNRRRNTGQNGEIFANTTLPLLGPVVLVCVAIFFSNFSTAVITFFTCWVMLYIGRVRVGELWRLVGIALVTVIGAVALMYVAGAGRAETVVHRITDFLKHTEQVEQSASDDNLQIVQAKIAIASGGIFGKGPGNSTQRANLPHSYSDFAYAFIVEEYGIVGAMAVLLLYLWIFFRSILIFQKCGTAFPSLLVLGLGLMIVLQALFNMLVSVNLFPVTGQTLPLISLGGSSLLFTSLALGMILGVSRQVEERSLDRPRGESLLEGKS